MNITNTTSTGFNYTGLDDAVVKDNFTTEKELKMSKKNEIKELIDQAIILIGAKTSDEIADYLAKNLVIKMPCKIGDMLYIKNRGKAKVIALYFDASGGMFDLDIIKNDDTVAGQTHFICKDYSFEDLGKTVFFNDSYC